jgi:branched-chain amino acid transport system substrate-binding protein
MLVVATLVFVTFFITNAEAQKQPYRFGLIMPQTGSQALFGIDQVQACLWGVEDINAKGGVNGRPLEAVVLDSQADPKLGISMATRLATVEKVPVFIVGWSSVVSAVAPVANRYKVLSLSVGAKSTKIAQLGDYTYTAFPLADVDISALAKYCYSKLNRRRAAVLYINNDTGLYAAQVYQDIFKKNGGEVVSVESYEPTVTDYTGALLKIKSSNPDIIHLQGLVADMPQVIAQMRQLGIHQTVTSYDALYNTKMLDQLGTGAGDIIIALVSPIEEVHPPVKGYLQRWTERKGRVPYGLAVTEYVGDSPYIIKALYEWLEAQKLPMTGENMRKALLAVRTFQTPLIGKIVVNSDHTVDSDVHLIRIVDGKFKYMETIESRGR